MRRALLRFDGHQQQLRLSTQITRPTNSLHTSYRGTDSRTTTVSTITSSSLLSLSLTSRRFGNDSRITDLSSPVSKMAQSTVLGIGVGADSPLFPDASRDALRKALDFMESDMQSSPYDWEMYYVEPDMDLDLIAKKLHERHWDVVMVGVGLRTSGALAVFFEQIVNIVHKELPKTKFAFNTSIPQTQASIKRALEY